MLEEGNTALVQARRKLEITKEDRRKFILHELNPRLAAVYNLGAALGSLASGDHGLRLVGGINIPDPFTLYAKRYALEIKYYQEILNSALLERRLKASLYGYFLQYESLSRLKMKKRRPLGLSLDADAIYREGMREVVSSGSAKRREDRMRISLNRLFNTPGSHWKLRADTLPNISYEGKLGHLDPDHEFGTLALMMAAGQMEASLARLWQVKVDVLPKVSNGVGIPTLYDSNSDTDFDVDSVNLFSSLSSSVDFTGRKSRRSTQVKVQVKLIQDQIKLALERDLVQLENVKIRYRVLLKQISRAEAGVKWMDEYPPPSNPKLLLDYLRRRALLIDGLQRYQGQKKYLDLQFWVWDDRYWGLPDFSEN